MSRRSITINTPMKQIRFFVLTLILLLSSSVYATPLETLQVGAASVDVTGEPGPDLGGFLARVQPSTHVRTRLFARAVYLENKPETLVWIGLAHRLSDEQIQFEETLNQVLRINYQKVATDYLNQQLAYQSSLQVSSMMFQMSLLNFL